MTNRLIDENFNYSDRNEETIYTISSCALENKLSNNRWKTNKIGAAPVVAAPLPRGDGAKRPAIGQGVFLFCIKCSLESCHTRKNFERRTESGLGSRSSICYESASPDTQQFGIED